MSDLPSVRLLSGIRRLLRNESSGGIVHGFVSLLALIISNSCLAGLYNLFLVLPVAVHVGGFSIAKPLLLWINDGLMAIFFLQVGLEVKREFLEGELSSWNRAFAGAGHLRRSGRHRYHRRFLYRASVMGSAPARRLRASPDVRAEPPGSGQDGTLRAARNPAPGIRAEVGRACHLVLAWPWRSPSRGARSAAVRLSGT
jgi:hypothetical protein